jgi:phosphoglucosamine mutase
MVWSALQVLAVMKQSGRSLAQLVAGMDKYPQVLINVRTASRVDVKGDAGIRAAQAAVEARLAGAGRVVLRASGTEPVIRVMVEAADAEMARAEAETLAAAVRAAA